MSARDLSYKQFRAALKRNGMAPSVMGYVTVLRRADGTAKLDVFAPNGGSRYRDQLAYLLRERDRELDRQEKEVRGAARFRVAFDELVVEVAHG